METTEKRRAMQVAIHIACKALGIYLDDYCGFMVCITGLDSTEKMSKDQLGAVLDELRRCKEFEAQRSRIRNILRKGLDAKAVAKLAVEFYRAAKKARNGCRADGARLVIQF